MTPLTEHDELLLPDGVAGHAPKFFDRFYFNVHGSDRAPYLIIGAGLYPTEGVADGYVLTMTESEQRNLRFSAQTAALPSGAHGAVGPLRWQIVEPHRRWRLQLGANEADVAFDLTWCARTAAWNTQRLVFDDGAGHRSDFGHFFQSGTYDGWLSIDGVRSAVNGWLGQRDRSRGLRRARR